MSKRTSKPAARGSWKGAKRPGRRRNDPGALLWMALGGAALVAVIVLAVVAFGRSGGGGSSGGLINSQATDFSLPTVGGGTFSLAEYKGKKNVLLYFNEGYG